LNGQNETGSLHDGGLVRCLYYKYGLGRNGMICKAKKIIGTGELERFGLDVVLFLELVAHENLL
jgi:hypothetical protein